MANFIQQIVAGW